MLDLYAGEKMKTVLFLVMWMTAVPAGAQAIKSDCQTVELKVLHHPEFAKQFVINGSIPIHDCTPVMADKELLLINVVASTKAGLESYISLFERKGFNEKATAVFKSPALAFDTFPVLVKNVQRLAFVHPSSDKSKLVLFMSLQTGPATTRLARWEYTYDKKELIETNRNWTFDAGIIAKIYEDANWRALISERSVEL